MEQTRGGETGNAKANGGNNSGATGHRTGGRGTDSRHRGGACRSRESERGAWRWRRPRGDDNQGRSHAEGGDLVFAGADCGGPAKHGVQSRIQVGNSGVQGVRIGTDASATTRVVVDLERPCKYELVPGPADKLTLKLDGGAVAQAVKASAPAPAEIAKASVSAASPAAAEPKQETPTAQSLVIVEPTYTQKKADTVEPTERATGAASKFVERPEGNLLPVANGAMAQGSAASTGSQSAPNAIEPAVNLAAEQKTRSQQASSGPKYTGEPVSVNLKDVDLNPRD